MTITYGSETDAEGGMGDILHVPHGRDTIECATAYLGWPVAIGHRHRTGSGCTCQDSDSQAPCATPSTHPSEAAVRPLERGELIESGPRRRYFKPSPEAIAERTSLLAPGAADATPSTIHCFLNSGPCVLSGGADSRP
ncbi:hypothetical protein GCM10020367_52110 [Streptomyces sannanensis]|uniref:Uncharacterized protein n=1 Tax=Streptomyces sannanensis TaxID=285536 RepID=A0ABP6SI50_9ACTN